ncbi:hypothetical protein VA596_23975 [Amycolatopsis sp., V23-08]|uniref:ATP-grasp domain-containing protein n=1 Tax=Amycolatopsis heterodermiae TaxID=3110235 RepID=A0ABU5R9V2_9PSEU|nr:hypothetical protein [Amycolatopsis sp., V23-08]MEA5362615.1 hypothetical protein [Amycolatopsis sp., V23-08]
MDIIVERHGSPRLLEVNDRPLGLSAIRHAGLSPAQRLAHDLRAHAGDRGEVGVVLAEAFALPRPVTVRGPVRISAPASGDDARIGAVTADLTAFSDAVTSKGGTVVFAGATDRPPLAPGTPVWNRSTRSLGREFAVVNSAAASAVCVDKTVLRGPEARAAAAGALHVLKPRWGSGSRHVHRGTLAELDGIRRAHPGEVFLCEPWIDGAVLQCAGKPYRFDLRVFVVGGRAAGTVVRRAAAPAVAPFDDSPLSWLTTTGPVLNAVAGADRRPSARDGLARLPGTWLAGAAELAESTVSAAERAAAGATAAGERPEFGRLHGIAGRLVPVPLGFAEAGS